MKFLKFAIVPCLACWLLASASGEGGYDLEKISTNDGRVYRDILVVEADRHGLMFRHRDGIAKVDYEFLSRNLRMLYEPVSEVEEKGEGGSADSDSPDGEGDGEGDGRAGEAGIAEEAGSWTVTLRSRTIVAVPRAAGWRSGCRPCGAGAVTWRRHWPRYHPAHALAGPICREAVVRDFLYTTGLLARPPGVTVRRLGRW